MRAGSREVPAQQERVSSGAQEERVERDGFGECHADDALHENFRGGTRIATDGFGGLEADEPDPDGGAEAA